MHRNVETAQAFAVNKNGFRERTVDVVDICTLGNEAFQEEYVISGVPCILRGVAESWPAYHQWKKSFFQNELGQIPILYHHVSHDGHTLDWLKGLPQTSLSNFIDRLDRGEAVKHFEVGHPYYDFFGKNPALLEDVHLQDLAALLPPGKFLGLDRFDPKGWPFIPPNAPQLFMAGPNAVSSGHYDPDHSHTFHWCVWGNKTVKLFAYDEATKESMKAICKHNLFETLDDATVAETPLLEKLDGWSTTLVAGDLLFIPSRMWHFFRYEETAMSFVARCRSFDDWTGYREFAEDEQFPLTTIPLYATLWGACERHKRTWTGQFLASQPRLAKLITRLFLFLVRALVRDPKKP